MFDSGSNSVTYLTDEHSVDADYVEDMISIIKQKMTFSAAILDNDYYRFVYDALYGPADTQAQEEATVEQ